MEIHIPQHQTENKAGQQGDQDTKGGRRREKKQPVSNEKHYIKDRRWTWFFFLKMEGKDFCWLKKSFDQTEYDFKLGTTFHFLPTF